MALDCFYWSPNEVLNISVLLAKGAVLPWLGTAQHTGCCVSSPGVNVTFLEAMKEACTGQAVHSKQELLTNGNWRKRC